MTNRSRVDPFSVICPQCKAPVGMNCLYVHPKEWTTDSQRRFFHRVSVEEQVKILKRAGTYTKQPHLSRFSEARLAADAEELRKIHEFNQTYEGGPDKLTRIMDQRDRDENQLPLIQWSYTLQEPSPIFSQLTLGDSTYYHSDMIDAARAKGYREGMEEGIKEGLRKAIHYIDEEIK